MLPEGDHEPFDLLEEGDKDENDDEENVNPFHGPADYQQLDRGRLEERLTRALELNSGVRIGVFDFRGMMHAEDFLDWESSLENYFEWKPMAEDRKVLFVKMKLKGIIALQRWKRLHDDYV
ncbi:hypothetical protein ACH5RR_008752 [Cinchona calisaya]|uniref:Uncharacterized protein n=1 Tax=Cinchona calisaya TaxID=153742 RepID=A0ABD3AC84_9GENT